MVTPDWVPPRYNWSVPPAAGAADCGQASVASRLTAIEIFVEVARAGKFSAAAEQFEMTDYPLPAVWMPSTTPVNR